MKVAPPLLDRIVTLDNMSQIAHVMVAMWVVEHVGRWTHHPVIVMLIVIVLAGFKESIIDPWLESVEVRGNGWKDWASFVVGSVVGYLLV